jgi:cellulase/cellobiase CelA1
VTVSYSTLRQWDGGFMGQLVVVDQGGSAVTGWQMVITLPDDQVQMVWNANWQPGGWDSVIMTPVQSDQVIEPGTSVSVTFVAQGDTTEPTNCTFNGSPCLQHHHF